MRRRHCCETWRRRWAYVEVIPPTFEYAETLAAEAGTQLAEELYRFFDRDGRALALRPDLTIPTARLAGSKLYDQPLPQRFFYTGPAFRYEEPRAGRQREFWQAGIELIGAASPDADAEVLAFAAQALSASSARQFPLHARPSRLFPRPDRALELDAGRSAGSAIRSRPQKPGRFGTRSSMNSAWPDEDRRSCWVC